MHHRTGSWRAGLIGVTGALAAVIAIAAATAGPAQAHGDPGSDYKGGNKGAEVEPLRTYDPDANQTTFSFTLTLNPGSEPVSHVLMMACPDLSIVSATGPQGTKREPAEGNEPKADPSIEGSPHNGIKFEPGVAGTYTIVFVGNIAGAEFVVKDGDAHKHFFSGPESDLCKTVTSTPPATTPEETTPTPIGPESEPKKDIEPATSNPGTEVESNQTSQPGTEVSGTNTTNNPPAGSSTQVLGAQLTQPEVQANLPRTGPALPLLAPIGALLVAFGGLVTAIGRRA